jgi:hypothetical protein
VNNRIKACFGKTFLILGYIMLLPFALAIIIMLFFPPTWIPLLVVLGIIWYFMKEFTKKKATGLLQIGGGSLFSGLIIVGLYMIHSKSSTNDPNHHAPAVIAKSQTHSQENQIQKSTAGPTLTAAAELEKKHPSGKTEDVEVFTQDSQGNVQATAAKVPVDTQQQQRTIAKVWFDKNAKILAETGDLLSDASNDLRNGDNKAAINSLTYAVAFAHLVNTNNPPDGWGDVASNLSSVLSDLDVCYYTLKEQITSNSIQSLPVNPCIETMEYINKGRLLAGYHWSTMGGTLADL